MILFLLESVAVCRSKSVVYSLTSDNNSIDKIVAD